jgi:hypothetical protein
MSVTIEIRDVPDAVYRRIKSQAALFGMSISDFLLNDIRRITGRPAIDELRARLARYPDITLWRHLWTRFGPSVAGFYHRRRRGVDWGACSHTLGRGDRIASV